MAYHPTTAMVQAREIAGAPTESGRRLTSALAYGGRTESTVLLEEPETLDADQLQEEEVGAKAEAEEARPGLTVFTDGSRTDDGTAGYAVVWKNGLSWAGIKTHMDYNREAYYAERAAATRAPEPAPRRNTTPERATISTDASRTPNCAYCSRDYPFSSNPFHWLKLFQPHRNSALITLLLPSCTGSLWWRDWVAAGDRVPTDEADSERVVVTTIPVTTIG